MNELLAVKRLLEIIADPILDEGWEIKNIIIPKFSSSLEKISNISLTEDFVIVLRRENKEEE